MKIAFYGRLAELTGEAERTVDPPPEVVDGASLRAWLGADNPALRARLADRSVRMLVNDALVQGNPVLSSSDEVAFLPPVSGG